MMDGTRNKLTVHGSRCAHRRPFVCTDRSRMHGAPFRGSAHSYDSYEGPSGVWTPARPRILLASCARRYTNVEPVFAASRAAPRASAGVSCVSCSAVLHL